MRLLVDVYVFALLIRRPPRPTLTGTRFPHTTLFRSVARALAELLAHLLALLGRHRLHPLAPVLRRARSLALGEGRSEEHASELQSLMSSSYAVFCLKKKNMNKLAEKLKLIHE